MRSRAGTRARHAPSHWTKFRIARAGTVALDHTISKEEEAILWCSLEQIPEIYREPLVLFYREHQSVETVAQLDLTEDAVKQRFLADENCFTNRSCAFVEGALTRTKPPPGKAFTLGVAGSVAVDAGDDQQSCNRLATDSGQERGGRRFQQCYL